MPTVMAICIMALELNGGLLRLAGLGRWLGLLPVAECTVIEHVHVRWILSQDAAGIVVPLGPSVTRFAVGATVYDDSGL